MKAINHAFAFDYILSLAQNQKHTITIQDLYTIHNLLIRDLDMPQSGPLRTIHIQTTGVQGEFPDPVRIPELFDEFFSWLYVSDAHPVIKAAQAHLKILTIHPFRYENGKTARLLMNLMLLQSGYAPAIILPEQREAYCDTIALAQRGTVEPYMRFIIECLEKSEFVLMNRIELKTNILEY